MGSLARTYFARLPNLGSFFTNPRPRNTPERLKYVKYTKNYFRVVEQFSLLSVSPIREEQWPLLNLKQSAPHCRRSAVSLWTIFVSFCSIWAPHFLLSIVECWKLYQNGTEEQVEAHLLRNRSGLHAVCQELHVFPSNLVNLYPCLFLLSRSHELSQYKLFRQRAEKLSSNKKIL